MAAKTDVREVPYIDALCLATGRPISDGENNGFGEMRTNVDWVCNYEFFSIGAAMIGLPLTQRMLRERHPDLFPADFFQLINGDGFEIPADVPRGDIPAYREYFQGKLKELGARTPPPETVILYRQPYEPNGTSGLQVELNALNNVGAR